MRPKLKFNLAELNDCPKTTQHEVKSLVGRPGLDGNIDDGWGGLEARALLFSRSWGSLGARDPSCQTTPQRSSAARQRGAAALVSPGRNPTLSMGFTMTSFRLLNRRFGYGQRIQ